MAKTSPRRFCGRRWLVLPGVSSFAGRRRRPGAARAFWRAGLVDRVELFVTPQRGRPGRRAMGAAAGWQHCGTRRARRQRRSGTTCGLRDTSIMFTGLIEALGNVSRVDGRPAGFVCMSERHRIRGCPGESVCGQRRVPDCRRGDAQAISFDVSPETARVTTLGALTAGTLVNSNGRCGRTRGSEGTSFRATSMRPARSTDLVQEGDSYRLTFAVPASLCALIVHKGSIAVDGVSLTVASIDDAALGLTCRSFRSPGSTPNSTPPSRATGQRRVRYSG